MRHRVSGRKLGRNPSHRKAMFRNMACSLIRSVREYPELSPEERLDSGLGYKAKVAGRIVTTVPKAKELRPYVEKLVTLAKKAAVLDESAQALYTDADRGSAEFKQWRQSENWNKWNQAKAPVLALRRRAFSILRDNEAVDILFDELADRFADREGGYTRVVKLAERRLGDAGEQALIEFVGDRDRVKKKRSAPIVSDDEGESAESEVADAESESAEAESAEESETETAQDDSASEEDSE